MGKFVVPEFASSQQDSNVETTSSQVWDCDCVGIGICFESQILATTGGFELWTSFDLYVLIMSRTCFRMNPYYIVWLNGWVFVYELNRCGLESRCGHLKFRYHACFEQGVPWHSGNYSVWIHSETRTWHDKNIQSNLPYR